MSALATVDHSDSEEEGFGLAGVFTCEDYVEKTWKLAGEEQRLLCSNMSSTDHDLTGQIVWPASVLLTWFLRWYSEKDSSWLSKCNVLEVGAGCGLAGFFIAKKCASAIITDGNEVVIRLLERNRIHLAEEASNVTVSKLVWGLKDPLRDMLRQACIPDIIIGADVILWTAYTRPLLVTLRWLLKIRTLLNFCSYRNASAEPSPVQAFVSYVERATTTTDLFRSLCSALGLQVTTVGKDLFLPTESEDVTADLRQDDRFLFQIELKSEEIEDVHRLYDQYHSVVYRTDSGCSGSVMDNVEQAVCRSIAECEELFDSLVDDAANGAGDAVLSQLMSQAEAPF